MCVFLFCAANGDIHLFSYFTYEKKKNHFTKKNEWLNVGLFAKV